MKDDGGWTLVVNDDHSKMWASPLGRRYTKPATTLAEPLARQHASNVTAPVSRRCNASRPEPPHEPELPPVPELRHDPELAPPF